MDIKIVYPDVDKRHKRLLRILPYLKIAAILAIAACAIVNICVGGKAWSIVAIWGIIMLWSNVLSPDTVEYNRLSQSVKTAIQCSILLALIDLCLSPGWALNVIAIVCFSSLLFVALLFFSDYQTQRQNMYPMLLFCVFCLLGSGIALAMRHGQGGNWPLIVLASVSSLFMLICMGMLGRYFIIELKKRFSIK